MPVADARTVYSRSQLEALWVSAGGNPAAARIAAAVALAESGGHAGARNVNTNGTVDRGLWQVNSVHGALSTFDPVANARAAVRISGGGSDWQPWTTFNSGAYRQFLSGASPTPPPGSTGGNSGPNSNLFSGLVGSVGKALLYVALILGGAALIGIGVHRAVGGRA
jgi:hypothetical protein